MRPLSTPMYFLRNRRRIVPVFTIIALAVVGVSLISVVGASQFLGYQNSWGEPFRYFAYLQSTGAAGDPATLQQLKDRSDVERVIPAEQSLMRLPSLLSSIPTPIFALQPDDFPLLLEHTHDHLIEGKLPGPDENGIVLDASIMRARKLKVGDVMGKAVDDRETFPGKWTVTGVIDGPTTLAFVPLKPYQATVLPNAPASQQVASTGYMVFPKPGQMAGLDDYIRTIPRSEFAHTTFVSENEILNTEYNSAKLVIWVIDIVTVSVLSLAAGLLNTIYFMQRMHEYGTLAAIGYSISFLIRRTLSEAMSLTVVAWLLGLVAAEVLTILLRQLLFSPRGYSLASLDLQAVYFTLPIPILIAAFSLVTVFRQFRRLDPVTIVEGRG